MYFLSSIVVVLVTGNLVFSEEYQKTFYKAEEAESLFEDFIVKYERVYKDEQEKQLRLEIFKKKLERINELNSRNEYAVFGINKFTDYTKEELEMLKGLKLSANPVNLCTANSKYDNDYLDVDDDDEFDWRKHNAVTEVKDQKLCGSCYAFSTIGNIEGQVAIHKNQLVRLSEQQIVDCDKNEGDGGGGCDGGFMYNTFTSLINMGGVMAEQDYPYAGALHTCKFDKKKVKTVITGCFMFNKTNEVKLARVLKHVGPLSFAINAESLEGYNGGIITEGCIGEINHAVLLVGFGSENGVPYWIVKNSWGKGSGEKGFFRIKRGINALCMLQRTDLITSAVIKI